jgi:hypothetical protein
MIRIRTNGYAILNNRLFFTYIFVGKYIITVAQSTEMSATDDRLLGQAVRPPNGTLPRVKLTAAKEDRVRSSRKPEVVHHSIPVQDVVSDLPYVLLAFKCCIEEDDHIVNKVAVWLTSFKQGKGLFDITDDSTHGEDDECFRGRISHVEILIKQRYPDEEESEWYRYSIMKKIGKRSADGKITFSPGVVHRIKTSYVNGKMQVKNYRFYRVELGVEGVNASLQFLQKQVTAESPFNTVGYILNFVSPILVGVSHYKQAERRRKNKWFCTELIVCALQAGGLATYALRKACSISPNKLYDLILDEKDGILVFSGDYLTG